MMMSVIAKARVVLVPLLLLRLVKGAWFGSFEHLGLRGVEGVEDGLAIPAILFAMFQMTFAIITPALISGAVVERMLQCIRLVHHAGPSSATPRFATGSGVEVGLAWGVLDFGAAPWSTCARAFRQWCVQSCWDAEAPRREARPHNVPFVLLGGGLWFGWFGFNGGSALAADETAAMAVMTTTLAAAAAMMAWTTLCGSTPASICGWRHDWAGGIGHDHPGRRVRLADGGCDGCLGISRRVLRHQFVCQIRH